MSKSVQKTPYPHLRTYNYIVSVQLRFRQAKSSLFSYVFLAVFRILFAITLLLFVLGLALFAYFIIHHVTLPTMLHVLPVHLQYSDCTRSGLYCEYPNATVPFVQGRAGKESPLLMAGQKYAMWLRVDLPESEVVQENAKSGVFMVRLALRSHDGLILRSSSRPALMRYRSYIHHLVRVVFLSPFYLLGYLEERQKLHIDLMESYQEDPYTPVTDAVIEMQKATVSIYEARLLVEARLEGLRYWMQRYPLTVGMVIVSMNFLCGVALASLSVYNRFAGKEKIPLEQETARNDFGFERKPDPLEYSEMEVNAFEPDKKSVLKHRKAH